MKSIRLAFAGASGTGKTTLAAYAAELLGLPVNPVGSRSVAAAMGFASPYDVDRAGRRAEFQQRLLAEKVAWEREHERESFVTDRTTLDVLAYFALHDVRGVNAAALDSAIDGLQRYTHIAYCPVRVFCKTGSDPNRVHDVTYHHIYDALLDGLIRQHTMPWNHSVFSMDDAGIERRQQHLRHRLGLVDT